MPTTWTKRSERHTQPLVVFHDLLLSMQSILSRIKEHKAPKDIRNTIKTANTVIVKAKELKIKVHIQSYDEYNTRYVQWQAST